MDINNLSKNRRVYSTYTRGSDGWEYFDTPEEAGVTDVSYGDIKEDEKGDFIELPYCTYSDYSGCTVERSNCRCILEDYKEHLGKGVYRIYGGFDTTGVLVSVDFFNNNEELQDAVEGLLEYPLYSEEDHSQLEMEIEDEDWELYRKQDLMDLLDKAEIEYDEETLYSDFLKVQDRIGEYTIFEDAVSSWVDLDNIIKYWDYK